MLYIYTSIVGGFDNLRPPAVPPDDFARYICFTDLPNLPRVTPWEYRPVVDIGKASRTARVAKILPHLMLPEDADFSIYHDGNFQLHMDPHRIVAELLGEHDWAAHTHPCRKCVYEEAGVLLKEGIGTRDLVEKEIERYRASGYPENGGLWANGLIVRRHTGDVAELNERWWRLYDGGCERDQLSFPVARRELGVSIKTIDANIYSSPYILFRWHAAFKNRDDNSDYWPQRARIRQRLDKLGSLSGHDIKYPEY